MSPERVERMLSRLAYEVVERNQGTADLEIFGILRSGAVVAQALARHIGAIEAHPLAVHALDVQAFRDDRARSARLEAPAEGTVDVTDRAVILVDDVLFTGRTARAALDAIIRYGRPRSIQLAVLIDRGHREYPIQPDYIGRALPTKHKERVVVDVNEGCAVYVEE